MPTQVEIAAHLDLDQSAVSRAMERLAIDWRTTPMEAIRVAYIRQLRAQAAGHKAETGEDLVRERVQTERVERELKLLELDERRGLLVNVAQLEPALMQMVQAFRTELLARDDKLKTELDAVYRIDCDVGILNEHTRAALDHLARYDPSGASAGAAPGREPEAAGADRDDGLGGALPEDLGEGIGPAGDLPGVADAVGAGHP
jgi:hypothetical protein